MGKNAPVSYGYQIQADPTNVVGKRVGAFLIDALIGTAVSVPDMPAFTFRSSS